MPKYKKVTMQQIDFTSHLCVILKQHDIIKNLVYCLFHSSYSLFSWQIITTSCNCESAEYCILTDHNKHTFMYNSRLAQTKLY